MSDEQANEVIKLRHRLRAMALQGNNDLNLNLRDTLNRFCTLSESLGDIALCMEAARWRTRFEQRAICRPL